MSSKGNGRGGYFDELILAEIISRAILAHRPFVLPVCETQGLIPGMRSVGQNSAGATCPSSNKENVGMKSRLGTSAAASSITSATRAS